VLQLPAIAHGLMIPRKGESLWDKDYMCFNYPLLPMAMMILSDAYLQAVEMLKILIRAERIYLTFLVLKLFNNALSCDERSEEEIC